MSTYVIGDVQGCYDELLALLGLIQFNENKDSIWFTGDLVNRGPKSLEVLRFISNLSNAICVLGNHDLMLLALAYTHISVKQHTLDDILFATDREPLLAWLRNQPLLYENDQFNSILVHAGIPPQWNLEEAKHYAEEVTDYLRGEEFIILLENLFGNSPSQWSEHLSKWERVRYIINGLTRMRWCDQNGAFNLSYKGKLDSAPAHLLPWFQFPLRQQDTKRILFGHWAALEGKVSNEKIEALDTGCYWGGYLTALCLETGKRYQISCQRT
jgi:bis(5'-nucleosyl)-tetraphosphatase (symmetrical)